MFTTTLQCLYIYAYTLNVRFSILLNLCLVCVVVSRCLQNHAISGLLSDFDITIKRTERSKKICHVVHQHVDIDANPNKKA